MFHLTKLLTRSTPSAATGRARVAAAMVLAVALSAGALAGCSRDADEPDAAGADDPERTSAATPDAGQETDADTGDEQGSGQGDGQGGGRTPVDLTPDEVDDIEQGTDDYLDDRTDALEEPDQKPRPADHPRVTGAALEDLFNQVAEFQNNGWRMDGTPTIVRQRIVRRTKNPDGVVVRVCVDNSDVRVLDRNGDEVPNSRAAEPRTVNVLTLLRDGTDWTVSDQRLAPKPDC